MIEIRVVAIKSVGARANMIRIDRSTPYGNHTPLSDRVGRMEAIRNFELEIQDRPRLIERLMHQVLKLAEDGHTVVYLGCHCHPLPCHGDVLKRLLEERLT